MLPYIVSLHRHLVRQAKQIENILERQLLYMQVKSPCSTNVGTGPMNLTNTPKNLQLSQRKSKD